MHQIETDNVDFSEPCMLISVVNLAYFRKGEGSVTSRTYASAY